MHLGDSNFYPETLCLMAKVVLWYFWVPAWGIWKAPHWKAGRSCLRSFPITTRLQVWGHQKQIQTYHNPMHVFSMSLSTQLSKMNSSDLNPLQTHGCGSSERPSLLETDEEKLRSPSPSSRTNVSDQELASQKHEMNHNCELGEDPTGVYIFPSFSLLFSH